MLNISQLRKLDPQIIAIVPHMGIIQSMLDYDYLLGKEKSAVVGIVGGSKKSERFFFGSEEILLPVYPTLEDIPSEVKQNVNLFLNASSGRRTLSTSLMALDFFPNLVGGTLFAEDVPEKNSLALYEKTQEMDKFIVGPASVGLLIPKVFKLGAIGGVEARQLVSSSLTLPGKVAVFSASGGMTNEIISILAQYKKHLSFALSFGDDRFPVLTPKEAFLAAEDDEETEAIVYYGELGGYDEYEIAELLKEKKVTKKVIVYIAGSISEMFETPPQFGHAKAMAKMGSESALEKRKVLTEAGAFVASSFKEFVELIKELPESSLLDEKVTERLETIENRKKSLFTSTISGEKDGEVYILGESQESLIMNNSFASITASLLIGKKIKSREFEEFTDFILKALVDHGPYQSGAINTMITARGGKDLVSSLAAGLLTIGPRFGGAVNEAALNWVQAIQLQKDPFEFVEDFAKQRKYISGIGHKKYRADFPDPRVKHILSFVENFKEKKFTTFALEVEKITTAKKGNLILNVDGAMAAALLDILSEKEEMTMEQLSELIQIEFFNAFFVLSRAFGLTAHYLDQRRLDEGLFRLSPEEVKTIK